MDIVIVRQAGVKDNQNDMQLNLYEQRLCEKKQYTSSYLHPKLWGQ